MNQIYFEFPFLHINNYQIMPSLIVFFIFLVILLIRFVLRVLRNLIKQNITISGYIEKSVEDFKISIKNFKFIKKILSFFKNRNIWRYIFLSVTSYGMIFLLSYFFKDEKYLGDRANIIVKLANAYLKIELLVVLIMFFAFMYIFLVNKNKKAYFEFLKKPIVVLLYLSAFSYAVTHKIELSYKYNGLGYICLALFSILIFLVDIKDKVIENEQSEKCNPYEPIKNYDRLCKSQKDKADALKNIIERNSNLGGISILVKGDWGIGKTSVVNGAIQKLKKDSKYEELRINALEIDSLESLFNYFFDFIRRCLKERGAYTGIASEYREFVSSALGIVTTESFGNVFTRFFYSENKGYRDKKDELEKSIGNVLGRDKIIIVVDDIERCEKEKIKQFIFFIKEIATMNNCITIFVSDEKALKKCIDIEMNDFLDKFFNYTISVNNTDYTQVLDSLSKIYIHKNYKHYYGTISKKLRYTKFKKINRNLKYNKLGFLKLKKVIELTIDSLDQKIKKVQQIINNLSQNHVDKDKKDDKEKKLENLKGAKIEFEDSINNPRKLTKIYNSYLNYKKNVSQNFKKFKNDKDGKKNKDYLEQINASKLMFSLAYIFECFPEKIDLIEKRGIQIYLNEMQYIYEEKELFLLQELTELNIMKEFDIFEYANGSIYSYEYDYNYRKKEKFINNLVKSYEITPDIFTNKEQELLSYVEDEDWEKIIKEDIWFDIVKIIIENSEWLNVEENKKYSNYIEFILNHLKNSILDNTLKSYEIFLKIKEEFRNTYSINKIGMSNICIMKLVYELFFKDNEVFYKLEINRESVENRIKTFSIYFISSRLTMVLGGILYIPYIQDKNKIIEYTNNIELNSGKVEDVITGFLKILCNDGNLKYVFEDTNLNDFEKLEKIIYKANKCVEKHKLFDYKDVELDLNKASDSVEDIKYFLKILYKLNLKEEKIEITNENIVSRFLLDSKKHKMNSIEVSTFFQKIEKNVDVDITKKQIEDLNEFISELFNKKTIGHPRSYRRILLWHLERISKSEEM